MAKYPKNPQNALCDALRTRNLKAAHRYLSANPELLTGAELGRARIAVAALGPIGLPVEEKLAGWQWLDDHQFVFPVTAGEGYDKVLGHALEKEPLAVVNAWRARTPEVPVPSKFLTQAFYRSDTAALQWWADQGLSFQEHPWDCWPHVLLTLLHHKLNATAHVKFLLDHGVKPLARVETNEPHVKLESPLIRLTRQYKDLEKVDAFPLPPEAITQFRAMWVALVAAGDDPAYRSDLKECPLDLIKETSSAGWWSAWQRQANIPSNTAPTCSRRRMRS